MAFLHGGASATGRSHLDKGTSCEDAWQVIETDTSIAACVCDGAGSASHSARGANLLASSVCQAVIARADHLHSPTCVLALVEAIEAARQTLSTEGPLSDFHATLCGVVMNKEQSLVFHLGDGVAMGVNSGDWDDFVVSEPENGEFAETTYFFTLPGWKDHLRVFTAPKRYRTWFLMSDGAASFAVKTSPWRPTPNFMKPVHDYLTGLPDTHTRNQALMSTLESPDTDRITADDKTLVWIDDKTRL